MSIEEYSKKQLFGSIDKNKIPGNLSDYNCELIIEDYTHNHNPNQLTQKIFLNFTHKNKTLSHFRVEIDNFIKPKNLVYAFSIDESEKDVQMLMGEKM